MKIRPSVLIIKNNRLLTMMYRYEKANVYTLPGGKLEFGEELKPALKRELMEELGIDAEIGDLKYIAQLFMDGLPSFHFVFECLSFKNKPELNPEETTADEIVWVPVDELDKYNMYPNITEHIMNSNPVQFLGTIQQTRY